VPLFLGAVSPLTQCGLGRGLPSIPSGILIHPAVWSRLTWGETLGVMCPFLCASAGCPSNTMWSGLRSTSIPRGIVIHPTVLSQYNNVADRTGQTTARWHIGRTVLQTVARKRRSEKRGRRRQRCVLQCRPAFSAPVFSASPPACVVVYIHREP